MLIAFAMKVIVKALIDLKRTFFSRFATDFDPNMMEKPTIEDFIKIEKIGEGNICSIPIKICRRTTYENKCLFIY